MEREKKETNSVALVGVRNHNWSPSDHLTVSFCELEVCIEEPLIYLFIFLRQSASSTPWLSLKGVNKNVVLGVLTIHLG